MSDETMDRLVRLANELAAECDMSEEEWFVGTIDLRRWGLECWLPERPARTPKGDHGDSSAT